MIRWLRSLFAWRLIREAAVWHYFENTVTGERKAVRVSRSGQPLDLDWLERRPPGTSLGSPPPPSRK